MVPFLQASGIQLKCLGPETGDLASRLASEKLTHIPFRMRAEDGTRLPLEELRQQLATVFHEVQPDLVHANSLSISRIMGPVTKELGIPSVGHLRDILRLSRKAIDDINCCDRILCVSAAVKDFHVAAGMNARQMHVQYNGVNLGAFCGDAEMTSIRSELGIAEQSTLVLSIGQLGLRKATHLFLECAAILADEIPDCHWLVIGERHSTKQEAIEYEASLRRLAEVPQLRGRVHFLGRRHDVPLILQQADLLVHTARQEPLGRVLLEAAAAGLAIVATDVGGTREIFPDDSMASVVSTLPSEGEGCRLASAVRPLLLEPARRMLLGVAARQRAEKSFNVEEKGLELAKQYFCATGVVPPQHP